MNLTNEFWNEYELDLQEVKIAYLRWALDHAIEPNPQYRHHFLWDHQTEFCIINSRYGHTFAASPFGINVWRVHRSEIKGNFPIDEQYTDLKQRLSINTIIIKEAIKYYLSKGDIQKTKDAVLNFYWLKLGTHELLFDKIQYTRDFYDILRKGRWGLDESEEWHTLTGIRNRIINAMRYGEEPEDEYMMNLDKKLPGFSPNSQSIFLSSAMTWNRYALCAFDCGPVLWSRSGFVHFSQIKKRMNQLKWPYESSAEELLRPFYHIALDYRKPPIRVESESEYGYSLKSMRKRKAELHDIFDKIINDINRIRRQIRR